MGSGYANPSGRGCLIYRGANQAERRSGCHMPPSLATLSCRYATNPELTGQSLRRKEGLAQDVFIRR